MLNRFLLRFIVAFILLPSMALPITHVVHAFRSYNKPDMIKMEIIGQVSYKSKRTAVVQKRVLDFDNRQLIFTARLFEREGLRLGDKVFIIKKDPNHKMYKNGLIVGEAEVYSIFKTEFQGWMMKASGNLSMVAKGFFVARLFSGESRQDAWRYYRRGDTYRVSGDYISAYKWYQKSLKADPNKPETMMRLAEVAKHNSQIGEAHNYIREAWKRLNKFQDANDVLELPGKYVNMRLFEAKKIKSNAKKMKNFLSILKEIRFYKKRISWYKSSLRPETLRMLERKGIPNAEFQYAQGQLYRSIYTLLTKGNRGLPIPLLRVLKWLHKKERKILYRPIHLAYHRPSFVYPKKHWDKAFFDAANYHFQLAYELRPLDVHSSYSIVTLNYERFTKNPTPTEREVLKDIMKHYIEQARKVPFDKNISKRLNIIAQKIK